MIKIIFELLKMAIIIAFAMIVYGLCGCSLANAASIPVSIPDPSLPCYATVTETAQEALRAAVKLGGDKAEAGGGIYQHGSLYCYTAPVTQGLPGAVDYRVGLVKPDVLVALYHTHPGDAELKPERLSKSDIALAKRVMLTMYIMSVESQRVLSYNPSK